MSEKQNTSILNKCFNCGLERDATKEAKCVCCGKTFMAKHQTVSMVGLHFGCGWTKYCDRCQKQVDATRWFTHHRKEPTPKELEKEIRKLLTVEVKSDKNSTILTTEKDADYMKKVVDIRESD